VNSVSRLQLSQTGGICSLAKEISGRGCALRAIFNAGKNASLGGLTGRGEALLLDTGSLRQLDFNCKLREVSCMGRPFLAYCQQ
jgi:hypothetical protein